jgi:hypothetical protein
MSGTARPVSAGFKRIKGTSLTPNVFSSHSMVGWVDTISSENIVGGHKDKDDGEFVVLGDLQHSRNNGDTCSPVSRSLKIGYPQVECKNQSIDLRHLTTPKNNLIAFFMFSLLQGGIIPHFHDIIASPIPIQYPASSDKWRCVEERG